MRRRSELRERYSNTDPFPDSRTMLEKEFIPSNEIESEEAERSGVLVVVSGAEEDMLMFTSDRDAAATKMRLEPLGS